MSKELEIELKNMVTKEHFTRLQAAFAIRPEDFQEQENLYFDTPDFALKALQSALRIRKKQGSFQLTLKTPETEGLLETSQLLDAEDVQNMVEKRAFPDGEVKKRLNAAGISCSSLAYFGTLTTKRAEISYKGGLLVFDHNFYLNKEDYEIEYEVSSLETGIRIFKALLKQYGIPFLPAKNKVRRFYEAKIGKSQDQAPEPGKTYDHE
ncbi:CYTH domain-containing protein [Heyndrickxia acidiproducens]|uniref:CYTH domain-containing protein n=1 Tax=Heyndrickxia acidiproducens TaxID=1121084 RepID=UPI00037B8986|nr:CYTH domain-containing protein [Heyndrickxia acidiproducens]